MDGELRDRRTDGLVEEEKGERRNGKMDECVACLVSAI